MFLSQRDKSIVKNNIVFLTYFEGYHILKNNIAK